MLTVKQIDCEVLLELSAIDQLHCDTKMLFGNHRTPLDKLAVKLYSILVRLIKLLFEIGQRRQTELCMKWKYNPITFEPIKLCSN